MPIPEKPKIEHTPLKGALAKRMAKKQREEATAAAAAPSKTEYTTDADTGLREELISLGVRFLAGPSNKDRDVAELLVFLEGKGLTPDEVVEALTRAGRW